MHMVVVKEGLKMHWVGGMVCYRTRAHFWWQTWHSLMHSNFADLGFLLNLPLNSTRSPPSASTALDCPSPVSMSLPAFSDMLTLSCCACAFWG